MTETHDLPAGSFSSWLRAARRALAEGAGADVPCGGCTACCRSSYFIHIEPAEHETRTRIPTELLFPAAGLPKGNLLLGYDENGRCPMLRDDTCSIYEHRPLTCRAYDCRVFAAAGIDADRAAIRQRARRWRFSLDSAADRDQHAAVQAAARFLQERAECFPGGAVPDSPAQLAILALKVYEVFLARADPPGEAGRAPRDAAIATAVIAANERFEAGPRPSG